jgi:hypothetical protein
MEKRRGKKKEKKTYRVTRSMVKMELRVFLYLFGFNVISSQLLTATKSQITLYCMGNGEFD